MIAHIFDTGFNIFIFFVICLKGKKNILYLIISNSNSRLVLKILLVLFALLILTNKEVGMEMENVHMCV